MLQTYASLTAAFYFSGVLISFLSESPRYTFVISSCINGELILSLSMDRQNKGPFITVKKPG